MSAAAPRDAPIGVALVGLGFGVRTLLPALLATPGVEVVAVCAAHQENADAVARAHGIVFATTDHRAAVGRAGVDLAALCVPPPMHAAMIGAALDAGRHMFSTKPLTLRLAEAGDLCDRARELGVVTAMEYCFRYLPMRRHLRALLRDGFLGEVRFVSESAFCDFATVPGHELSSWKWVSSRAAGGGILGASLALHHLDLLRYTFGELHETHGTASTAIKEKPVPGSPTGTTKPVDSEDGVVVQGRLDNGAPFSLSVSWSVHMPSGDRLEVYGSEGTLVVEPSGRLFGGRQEDQGLHELHPPLELSATEGAETWGAAIVPTPPLYVLLAHDLVGAIRGENDDPLFATFDDDRRLMEIASPILGGLYDR